MLCDRLVRGRPTGRAITSIGSPMTFISIHQKMSEVSAFRRDEMIRYSGKLQRIPSEQDAILFRRAQTITTDSSARIVIVRELHVNHQRANNDK